MPASDVSFFFSSTILQYKQSKTSKFTFLRNLMMKIKESKVLYYGQANFSLSQFHVMLLVLNQFSPSHFPQCIVISYFHNNEYIIIWGLAIKKLMPAVHIHLKNHHFR